MDGALVGTSSRWLFFASVFRKPVGALESLGNLKVDIFLFIKEFIETWNWDSLILKILKKPKPEVMTKSKNCPTQVITSIAQLWLHDQFWFEFQFLKLKLTIIGSSRIISRIGSTILEGVKDCHKNQFHNSYGPLGQVQFF
jgi:hypothetical protein